MVDTDETAFAAAEERGRIAPVTEPRARTARHDDRIDRIDRIVVELVNGCTFIVPPRLVQGRENASNAALALVDTGNDGSGLHREAQDVDVTVAGPTAGRFGTRRYVTERFGTGWDAEAAA